MLYAYIEKTGKKDFQMKIGRVSDPRPHPLRRGPSRLTYAELAVVVAEAGQGGGVPGLLCTSWNERNWSTRSGIWHEERSRVLNRS
jgi:hypothetical protein